MTSPILLIPLDSQARRQGPRRREQDGEATFRLATGEHHGSLNEHLTSHRMNRAALTLESNCVPVIRSQLAPPVASRLGSVSARWDQMARGLALLPSLELAGDQCQMPAWEH